MNIAERFVALERKYGSPEVLQETCNILFERGQLGELLDELEVNLSANRPTAQDLKALDGSTEGLTL